MISCIFHIKLFFYPNLSPGNQNCFIRMIDHPICTMILAFPKTENSYHNLFLISLVFFSLYGRKEIYFKVKIIKFQVKINVFHLKILFKEKRFSFEATLNEIHWWLVHWIIESRMKTMNLYTQDRMKSIKTKR